MGALCSSSLASLDGYLASIDSYLRSIDRYLESMQHFVVSIEQALAPAATRRKSSYHDLPPELLDLVIARLPDPADRARARAVCCSWHAAVCRHGAQPWRLPSKMCPTHRLCSLPRADVDTVGSTDDWLALRVGNKECGKYHLHNPFVNKTVPLAELDAIVGHDKPIIYKFLMRSGVDDLIAVITNNTSYAFMVILLGKGVWLPPPRTQPYVDIIDIAFLQKGKLYAITQAEDLIPFDLAIDGEGRPMVTMGTRLIKNSPDYIIGHHEEEEQVAAAPNEYPFHNCSAHVWSPNGSLDNIYITSRHLIESGGKLLMVRHHQQTRRMSEYCPPFAGYITRGVEVFEADPNAGAWIPVTGGLGGGQALFISIKFSKSVAAPCGEVEEDVIYFMGTGEVFNLKTGTCSPSLLCTSSGKHTWLFHPELVF